MNYHLDFTDNALGDIAFLKKSGNKAVQTKLLNLLQELSEHPFTGTGKPELLKHGLAGLWSRRINRENRLVYEVTDSVVFILSARGHYD
ncbi:MAG: Txe/YoeB family addiction module toxin [Saprospiraceae bacterium]